MVSLGHTIPFKLVFCHIFVANDSWFKLINSRLSQRLCIKVSNQRHIFESGDLQQKMKKRSSSVNKGFLWAHTLFVRIINMEGGVTIEEVNCKLPLNYYTLQICTMYIVGLFYQCKTILSFNIMRSLGHRFYKLWQLQSAAFSSPAFMLRGKNEMCLLSRTILNITI